MSHLSLAALLRHRIVNLEILVRGYRSSSSEGSSVLTLDSLVQALPARPASSHYLLRGSVLEARSRQLTDYGRPSVTPPTPNNHDSSNDNPPLFSQHRYLINTHVSNKQPSQFRALLLDDREPAEFIMVSRYTWVEACSCTLLTANSSLPQPAQTGKSTRRPLPTMR